MLGTLGARARRTQVMREGGLAVSKVEKHIGNKD